MSVINVCYMSHFSHSRMGGQKSMLALIENLDREIFRPYAICPEEGELADNLRKLNCSTEIIPVHGVKAKNLGKLLASIIIIRKFIKANNIRIIHPDHERDALTAGIAKLRTKCKMVWHLRLTIKSNLDAVSSRLADGLIGISEDTKNRFKSSRVKKKFVKIYNGVNTELFKPSSGQKQLRNDLGLPEDRFIALFVGQIKEGKGVLDLIQAMSSISTKIEKKQMPILYLIGAFSDPAFELIIKESISTNNLENDVLLMPQQDEIYKWMQASDVLLLTSHEGVEGMGRVIFEAMACGTPVIGTDISGLREAITPDTGILINEKSPEDIAEAVIKLIRNRDLLRKFSHNGRLRALNHFDIKIHTRKIEQYYNNLLSK